MVLAAFALALVLALRVLALAPFGERVDLHRGWATPVSASVEARLQLGPQLLVGDQALGVHEQVPLEVGGPAACRSLPQSL
eukprot:6990961-Alexandrium_andersonii.AAC.1